MTQFNHLVGKPYVLGARGPDAYDCWGVVLEVYQTLGWRLPDFASAHLSKADIVRLFREQATVQKVQAVEMQHPVPWCILSDERKGHVGVYTPGCLVLHAAQGLGVVQERLDSYMSKYPQSRAWMCQQ